MDRLEPLAGVGGQRAAARRGHRGRRQGVVGPHVGRRQPARRDRRAVRRRRGAAQHLGRAAEQYPQAQRFTDWRRLLDRSNALRRGDRLDARSYARADRLAALQLGKHVFCQKPLTHTVFEARQMRRAAEKAGVVTQMCNQIQSHAFYRTAVKLVHDGAIGKVKEVHSWQSGPMRWLLVDDRPAGADPVPEGLHWDDWLGVAPARPYKEKIYHPFTWRAWQDFSNGQLGDFGCHILDPVFMALGLTAPTTIRAEAPALPREVWTQRSTVQYEFPGTEHTAGETIKLTWYDGEGHLPPREAHGLPEGFTLPGSRLGAGGREGHAAHPARRRAPSSSPRRRSPACNRGGAVARPLRRVGRRLPRRGQDDVVRSTTPARSPRPCCWAPIAIRVPGETLRWDAGPQDHQLSAANDLLRKSYRKGWEPAWVS